MEEDVGLMVDDYNSGLAFAAVDYTMIAVVMPSCRKHSGVAAGVVLEVASQLAFEIAFVGDL